MTAIASNYIQTRAGVGGGWRRIAYINTSTGGSCPSEWRQQTNSSVPFCYVDSDDANACTSAMLSEGVW